MKLIDNQTIEADPQPHPKSRIRPKSLSFKDYSLFYLKKKFKMKFSSSDNEIVSTNSKQSGVSGVCYVKLDKSLISVEKISG